LKYQLFPMYVPSIPLLFTLFSICFKWDPWLEEPACLHVLYSTFMYSIFHVFQMSCLIWKTSFFTYPIFCFYLLHFPYVSNDILDLKNQFFCISYIPLLFTLFSTCFKSHPWFEKPACFSYPIFHFYLLFSILEACRWINNSHRIVRQSPSIVNWMLAWISSLRTLGNDTKASNIRLELQLENSM
jgi:hypothetical protein